MSTTRYVLALGLVSGVAGGMLSSRVFLSRTVFAQAPPAKLVQAEVFQIVDKSGKKRVEINAEGLSMFDKDGTRRVDLWVLPDGDSVLALRGAGEEPFVLLGTFPSPGLEISDRDSKAGIAVRVNPKEPSVTLSDYRGRKRFVLDLGSEGSPDLSLYDNAARRRASLHAFGGVTERQERAGVTGNDQVGLTLYDNELNPRAVFGNANLTTRGTDITTRRPESSVVLFDRNGTVVWAVP